MTLTTIIIYLIVIPGLCMIIGILLGKRYGYNLRNNELMREQLLKAKKTVEGLNDSWEELNMILSSLVSAQQMLDFPPLEDQLKKAIKDEDYELAARIRDQLNQNEDE